MVFVPRLRGDGDNTLVIDRGVGGLLTLLLGVRNLGISDMM